MQSFFILAICIIAISLVVIVLVRIRLKNRSKELSERITTITPYRDIQESRKEELRQSNKSFFIDIETDLRDSFKGHIISSSEEEQFTRYYTEFFHEVNSLLKSLEAFHIEPSETILKFTHDFGNIHSIVKRHNEQVIQDILATHKNFFDHCLKYPLDKQQRRSIVSEEDNCLVISSAGSGKTSSIIGKVRYLIDIKHINPQNILLISYTNKAAAELTERMDIAGLRGYTFHKLAIDIIGKATGQKPSICDNTDALFVKIYHKLLEDEDFKKSIIEYFVDYQVQEADWEHRKMNADSNSPN